MKLIKTVKVSVASVAALAVINLGLAINGLQFSERGLKFLAVLAIGAIIYTIFKPRKLKKVYLPYREQAKLDCTYPIFVEPSEQING